MHIMPSPINERHPQIWGGICFTQLMAVSIPTFSVPSLAEPLYGVEEAQAVPLIESIEITAKINYTILPLPEGDSYLGFIFARGASPEEVEQALREAHGKLKFEIEEELNVLPVR